MINSISAIIFCYNEEQNLPRLFENLKGIEDIVVIDHLSTDRTAKIAKKFGARVYTQGNLIDTITPADIKNFEFMYGYKPVFTAGNTVGNFGVERNMTVQLCKNDWVYFPDADEIMMWDKEELEELMKTSDLIGTQFVHTHTPDGKPNVVFGTSKLYRKSKCWWTGRIHEYITGHNIEIGEAKKMIMHHYQIPKIGRSAYMPTLEFGMVREPDTRTAHYLGREYHNHELYDKAKYMFQLSLKSAWNVTEIISSYVHLAKCCWILGSTNDAKGYLFEAMKVDPTNKNIYTLMAEFCEPEKAKIWRKFTEVL